MGGQVSSWLVEQIQNTAQMVEANLYCITFELNRQICPCIFDISKINLLSPLTFLFIMYNPSSMEMYPISLSDMGVQTNYLDMPHWFTGVSFISYVKKIIGPGP